MLNLVINVLITWRLSSLLVHERGPFDVFGKLRDAVGVRYNAYSKKMASNELAEVFLCLWCMSIWVGWAVALLRKPRQWFAYGLAYSAGAIVMEKVTHGKSHNQHPAAPG